MVPGQEESRKPNAIHDQESYFCDWDESSETSVWSNDFVDPVEFNFFVDALHYGSDRSVPADSRKRISTVRYLGEDCQYICRYTCGSITWMIIKWEPYAELLLNMIRWRSGRRLPLSLLGNKEWHCGLGSICCSWQRHCRKKLQHIEVGCCAKNYYSEILYILIHRVRL